MNEPIRKMSFGEYLRLEALDERPFEFFDGEVVALAAPSLTHGDILFNVRSALEPAIAARGCRGYSGDATVESGTTFAARPDYVVTCDERDGIDPNSRRRGVLRYPWLVIEILSPATAARDLDDKVTGYSSVETITHYVIIDSRRTRVTLYERAADGFVHRGEVREVNLPRLGVSLAHDAIYRDISIAALETLD